MSVGFGNFSKSALALGFMALLVGGLALKSSLEWHWKLCIVLVSFGLYVSVMLAEKYLQQQAEEDKLRQVFQK
ncbi:MAG: hypothetical protein NWE99_09050 [Candidatus Bathyarchaeota archaeon]|nr:hypothetical protein [Candidatus Bathyarchaeota archaeon]